MLYSERVCFIKKEILFYKIDIYYYNVLFILKALSWKTSFQGVNCLSVVEFKRAPTEICVHSPAISLSIPSRPTSHSGCHRPKENLKWMVECLEKELHASAKVSLFEYVRDILVEEVMSSCNSSTDVKLNKVHLTL